MRIHRRFALRGRAVHLIAHLRCFAKEAALLSRALIARGYFASAYTSQNELIPDDLRSAIYCLARRSASAFYGHSANNDARLPMPLSATFGAPARQHRRTSGNARLPRSARKSRSLLQDIACKGLMEGASCCPSLPRARKQSGVLYRYSFPCTPRPLKGNACNRLR